MKRSVSKLSKISLVSHCAGATYIPPDESELSAGDAVKVELDPDLFKIAQEEHGGWNDAMAEVRTVCEREWMLCRSVNMVL